VCGKYHDRRDYKKDVYMSSISRLSHYIITALRPRRVFEISVNILTAVVAIVVLASAIRTYVFPPSPSADSLPQIPIGTQLKLDGVKWRNNGRTLIFAMQVGCRYCLASIPFYKDLLRSDTSGSLRTLAIFPQPVEESQRYVREHGLGFNDIRESRLSDIDVAGTPTLILVDSKGRVQGAWAGKLDSKQEAEVFHALRLKRVASMPAVFGDSKGVATTALQVDLRPFVDNGLLVDVRPRSAFAESHLAKSINIPLDELEARAPHELAADDNIVVYCDQYAPCETPSSNTMSAYCKLSQGALLDLGFSHVNFVTGDPVDVGAKLKLPLETTGDATN
jgi:hypothetical protein